MSEVTSGVLGPRAVAELRALAQQRVMLGEQLAAVDRREATLLAMIAEAQGCVAAPDTRFGYDGNAATWRALQPTAPSAPD
jgi:hypothetical protein